MLIMPDGRMNVHLIHNWPKNATKVTTSAAIPLNQWTHVVVSVTPPGKQKDVKIFFDGNPVAHTVDSDTLDGSTLTAHPVWLGSARRYASLRRQDRQPDFAGKPT